MVLPALYGDFLFFFFSSRRRHTRFDCDWSSDVFSSDLGREPALEVRLDLRDVLASEVEDRVEGLGLARLLAPDRGDEQLARLAEPAEAVEVTIEVVPEEGHGGGVVPRPGGGPARVPPPEQDLPQPAIGGRRRPR